MTIKISIVMPVYNAADFIAGAIDSIINQKFTEWELICVNDGSIDNSLEIIKYYASKDKRISFYTIPNSKALNARNTGVEKVSGEWLYFMDADDIVSSDILGEMFNTAISENADFVLPDQIQWFPHNDTKTFSFNKKFGIYPGISSRDAFLKYLKWEIHGGGMMKTKLYRKYSFYDDRPFMDEFIIRKIVLKCEKIAFSKGEYIYRQNDQSLVHKPSKQRFGVLERSRMSEELLLENFDDENIITDFREERLLETYGVLILFVRQKKYFSKEDRIAILRIIEEAYKKLDKKDVSKRFFKASTKGMFKSILLCSNWRLFKYTAIISNTI